ncbi:hypothetical protein EJ06DRAFT_527965 [Trichodelitschia bisporula]|uniref:Uncharacterized protein n=1 Tax=Trichodelitschia bisporula TaxID=703511 RepID=A0A6G1I4F6_9PEZI|nr:hypothetical protein EJ06DRAFT_527965 [Trichodelitschia bisporula]
MAVGCVCRKRCYNKRQKNCFDAQSSDCRTVKIDGFDGKVLWTAERPRMYPLYRAASDEKVEAPLGGTTCAKRVRLELKGILGDIIPTGMNKLFRPAHPVWRMANELTGPGPMIAAKDQTSKRLQMDRILDEMDRDMRHNPPPVTVHEIFDKKASMGNHYSWIPESLTSSVLSQFRAKGKMSGVEAQEHTQGTSQSQIIQAEIVQDGQAISKHHLDMEFPKQPIQIDPRARTPIIDWRLVDRRAYVAGVNLEAEWHLPAVADISRGWLWSHFGEIHKSQKRVGKPGEVVTSVEPVRSNNSFRPSQSFKSYESFRSASPWRSHLDDELHRTLGSSVGSFKSSGLFRTGRSWSSLLDEELDRALGSAPGSPGSLWSFAGKSLSGRQHMDFTLLSRLTAQNNRHWKTAGRVPTPRYGSPLLPRSFSSGESLCVGSRDFTPPSRSIALNRFSFSSGESLCVRNFTPPSRLIAPNTRRLKAARGLPTPRQGSPAPPVWSPPLEPIPPPRRMIFRPDTRVESPVFRSSSEEDRCCGLVRGVKSSIKRCKTSMKRWKTTIGMKRSVETIYVKDNHRTESREAQIIET